MLAPDQERVVERASSEPGSELERSTPLVPGDQGLDCGGQAFVKLGELQIPSVSRGRIPWHNNYLPLWLPRVSAWLTQRCADPYLQLWPQLVRVEHAQRPSETSFYHQF